MSLYYIVLLCLAAACASAMPREKDVVVLSPKFLKKVQNLIQKCEAETKAPQDTFSKMLQGIIENDASLNFIYCYLLEAGFVTKDGHFVVEKVLSLLKEDDPKQEVKQTFEECNKLNGSDNLETVKLMVKCYKDTSPIMFSI